MSRVPQFRGRGESGPGEAPRQRRSATAVLLGARHGSRPRRSALLTLGAAVVGCATLPPPSIVTTPSYLVRVPAGLVAVPQRSADEPTTLRPVQPDGDAALEIHVAGDVLFAWPEDPDRLMRDRMVDSVAAGTRGAAAGPAPACAGDGAPIVLLGAGRRWIEFVRGGRLVVVVGGEEGGTMVGLVGSVRASAADVCAARGRLLVSLREVAAGIRPNPPALPVSPLPQQPERPPFAATYR